MHPLHRHWHRHSVKSAAVNLLRQLTVIVLLGHAVRIDGADAKDLRTLVDFVIPAYTAMDFAVICAQDDPRFLLRTQGARGTVLKYAEHIKDEAINSLDNNDAGVVLKAAAGAARTVARNKLRQLAPSYPTALPGEIIAWCRKDATQFVRAIMDMHEIDHATLMQKLERAKR